jgi:hypothetical protein
MNPYGGRRRWLTLVEWVVLSAAALFVCFVFLSLFLTPPQGKGNALLDALAGVAIFGLIVPLAQAVVLRGVVARSFRWVAGSLAAWVATSMFDVLLPVMGTAAYTAPATVARSFIFGAIIGIAQWLSIRQDLSKPGLWIAASSLAWGTAALITGSVVDTVGDRLVFGFVPWIITGVALLFLLTPPSAGLPPQDTIAA